MSYAKGWEQQQDTNTTYLKGGQHNGKDDGLSRKKELLCETQNKDRYKRKARSEKADCPEWRMDENS